MGIGDEVKNERAWSDNTWPSFRNAARGHYRRIEINDSGPQSINEKECDGIIVSFRSAVPFRSVVQMRAYAVPVFIVRACAGE